jgi:hypothetical protein
MGTLHKSESDWSSSIYHREILDSGNMSVDSTRFHLQQLKFACCADGSILDRFQFCLIGFEGLLELFHLVLGKWKFLREYCIFTSTS